MLCMLAGLQGVLLTGWARLALEGTGRRPHQVCEAPFVLHSAAPSGQGMSRGRCSNSMRHSKQLCLQTALASP